MFLQKTKGRGRGGVTARLETTRSLISAAPGAPSHPTYSIPLVGWLISPPSSGFASELQRSAQSGGFCWPLRAHISNFTGQPGRSSVLLAAENSEDIDLKSSTSFETMTVKIMSLAGIMDYSNASDLSMLQQVTGYYRSDWVITGPFVVVAVTLNMT